MIASSTTIPIAKESPRIVKVFSVNPKNLITMNAPRMEVGIAKRMLNVALQEPKNNQHTSEVTIADRTSVTFSSWIESSMNLLRLTTGSRVMPSGRRLRTFSNFLKTARATSTSLLPVCLRIPNP